MLPRLSKLVLGGVIKTIGLEAAKQKAKWRTVKRQWALTTGKRACGDILDARKRFVDLEGIRELLNARRIRLKFILIVIVAAKRVSLQAAVRVEGHQ